MTYRHLEAPTTWTFEGWNGTNWIPLDIKTNITGWKLGEKREFTFDNSKPYKAYRLSIRSNPLKSWNIPNNTMRHLL